MATSRVELVSILKWSNPKQPFHLWEADSHAKTRSFPVPHSSTILKAFNPDHIDAPIACTADERVSVLYKAQCRDSHTIPLGMCLPGTMRDVALKSPSIPNLYTAIISSCEEETMVRRDGNMVQGPGVFGESRNENTFRLPRLVLQIL